MAASLAVPALARAQSSRGAIGVSATILPAPITLPAPQVTLSLDDRGGALVRIESASARPARTVTSFLRVTWHGAQAPTRAFVAHPQRSERAAILRLPASADTVRLRLERLVIAGT